MVCSYPTNAKCCRVVETVLLDFVTFLQYCCNILCHLCIKKILQNASKIITGIIAAFLLQNAVKFYYKTRQPFYCKTRQFYYKMLQVLQNASILLQNVADITKRVIYYKTGHNNDPLFVYSQNLLLSIFKIRHSFLIWSSFPYFCIIFLYKNVRLALVTIFLQPKHLV